MYGLNKDLFGNMSRMSCRLQVRGKQRELSVGENLLAAAAEQRGSACVDVGLCLCVCATVCAYHIRCTSDNSAMLSQSLRQPPQQPLQRNVRAWLKQKN